MRKRIIKNVLLLFMMILAMASLSACGKTKINLNDYVTITAEGYDSLGEADYEFDLDKLMDDYEDKIKVKAKNNSDYAYDKVRGYSAAWMLWEYCIDFEFESGSNLSNGDTVKFTWDCDTETALKDFGVELECTDIEYKITELDEVAKFNPFDYVEVTFSGVSPSGQINIKPNYDRAEMQYINFSTDNYYNFKNGDEVTVKASISGSVESFIEKYGAVLGEKQQTYTVEGLSSYISDITQLSTDVYDKIDKQLRDNLTADFASWNNEDLLGMELLGTYVLNRKEGSWSSYNNYVYFVYKVTAQNSKSDGPFEYYWYGYYTNVAANTDGSSELNVMEFNVPGSSEKIKFENQGSYSYYGFKDLDSLYNAHIVSRISDYEYTSTVNK